MPVYEYECPAHGPFEAVRSISEWRDPQACPNCGRAAPRAILTSVALATMPSALRKAHMINERSAHAPKSSAEHRHGASCGCCKPKGGKRNTVSTPNGGKMFPGRRPWMISH